MVADLLTNPCGNGLCRTFLLRHACFFLRLQGFVAGKAF